MAFLETSNLDAEIDIIEQQQHFCELFGHSSSIIYDCYTTKDSLAKKIAVILPQKNEKERNELTTTIWNLNAYNGGNCLFMSSIYITLVLDHKPSQQAPSKILSKSFQVHPVFRVQKCMRKLPEEIDSNCCAVFIDESGRVYMNWTLFQADNVYDDGLLVAPLSGIYNSSPDDKVKLQFFERKDGITRSLDRRSMVIGLAAASIAAITFIPAITVVPVVVVGAAAAGLSCAVYTGIRGIFKKHKRTIKFTNPEALSSWINVAAGAFTAHSATSTTQLVASTGMTNIIRCCLDDIWITKMHEFENMSIEITHLSTSLYLLTHSVKNHQTAQKMLDLSHGCELDDLKKILRHSQKLAINGLVHETMIIQGWSSKKTGQITVRSLKNVIDPQPILMELDHEVQEGTKKRTLKNETIKRKYLEIFDSRIAAFASRVLAKFKTRGENELKLFMINVMKEVSLNKFDDFITLVESMVEKYGSMAEARLQIVITFEHFAIMILKQLHVIGKDSNVTDLKEYLIGLTEIERSKIDDRIREYFEHLKEEHVQHADELLASHINISDVEKISIAIDGEVDKIKRKYLEIFDSRIATFASRVLAKFKTRGENELKLFMINVMKEVSLHKFDDFVTLVESMIEKYGSMAEARLHIVITFEHFAIMILKQLHVIVKDSNVTDLKEYLIGLTEIERSKIDDRIREYFEHLKEEHVQHADELLASHINISDVEKISIAIDGEVDKIKRKYLEIFDSRIAAFVSRVLATFKTRGENELKLFMINVMKEVSLHKFDDFITLVESMIEKYGSMAEARLHIVITFEHFAIMILKQLHVIGKDSNVTDLKEYLIGLTEIERSRIDDRIREYFEHLKEEHVQHADELLASHINISDVEKISIAIGGEVDKIIHNLQALNIVYMKEDLRETVKDVLLSMPLAASHIFFDIVTKFTIKNQSEIQSRLGRFIPIDIFMTDIHTLLKKVSISCGQELEHYLVDGSEAIFKDIEKKICQFYNNQLIVGNSNKCEHCAGFYYNLVSKVEKVH